MATRNPMNQRYQGEGPQGQTRKSASSIKPASEAASSVYIRTKPTTAAEKRAAEKARKKRLEEKSAERARRAELRVQKEKAAADLARAKELGVDVSELPVEKPQRPQPQPRKGGFFTSTNPMTVALKSNPDYRKWQKVYWIMLGIGLACIVLSFALQFWFPGANYYLVTMVPAYVLVIGSLIVNWKKVKPHIKNYQQGVSVDRTPKQIKHEQEAQKQAAELETARRAAKQVRRKPAAKGSYDFESDEAVADSKVFGSTTGDGNTPKKAER
ncbi:MAG: hypothetical protein FWF30_03010 [Coriobacteriia bacterium]|nr:hypothetical protein [Coriobacteriia bacterium]